MSIVERDSGWPCVTSLYDWETGCIVPALISYPEVAVSPVGLITDENGEASMHRLPDMAASIERGIYVVWAQHCIKICDLTSRVVLTDVGNMKLDRNCILRNLVTRLSSKKTYGTCGSH